MNKFDHYASMALKALIEKDGCLDIHELVDKASLIADAMVKSSDSRVSSNERVELLSHFGGIALENVLGKHGCRQIEFAACTAMDIALKMVERMEHKNKKS